MPVLGVFPFVAGLDKHKHSRLSPDTFGLRDLPASGFDGWKCNRLKFALRHAQTLSQRLLLCVRQ